MEGLLLGEPIRSPLFMEMYLINLFKYKYINTWCRGPVEVVMGA